MEALTTADNLGVLRPFVLEVSYPAVLSSVAALVLGSFATDAPPASVWQQFMNDEASGTIPVAVRGPNCDSTDEEAEKEEDRQALLTRKG